MPYKMPSPMYRDLLRGASYLLMPSLYEPFGAATEGALNGTPVVARATGGLWSQVRSLIPCPVPSFYGGAVEAGGHTADSATGILHREQFPPHEAAEQWSRILVSGPRERMEIPLYRGMVDAAHDALLAASDLYRRPRDYARIVVNAVNALSDMHKGWEVAVEKYRGIYSVAGMH
ncbi:MAG: hypothetical protein GF344_08475 [Chitinivibrionales bacterium]|nr:hypothetical protein [Chitinivibrionales bacterium]